LSGENQLSPLSAALTKKILENPLQRPLEKNFRRTGPSILSEFRFSTGFTFDKLTKETSS